jgi:glycosyltransferase involved in cell wall biosynthesis
LTNGSGSGPQVKDSHQLPRKPKLLIVVNYFYPYISGVSEYARWNGAAISDEFEITVLTGRHLPALPIEETIDGMHVIRADPLLHLHKGYISVDFIRRFMRLAAAADVINLHLPMLEAALLANAGSRYCPILLTYHCDVTATGGMVDWLAVQSVLGSAKIAARRADAIGVLTKDYAVGSPIVSGMADKLVEMPPIIKMERFPRTPGSRHGSFRLGFVGRFVKEKGIEVILASIAPIIKHLPDAKFVFVGETQKVAGGSIYETVADQLARHANHIEVLGQVSDEGLWRIYNQMDVLLLPSVNSYEGFGIVQIEAMLAGALVVASDLRGVRIPITRTGNGVLAQPGNVGSLVEAILACHSLRQRRSGEEVRVRTLEHYSNSAARERFATTLSRLIDRRRCETVPGGDIRTIG